MEDKHLYKNFEVDFGNPEKPATFELEDGVSPDQIKDLIQKAGYKAEVIKKASWLGRVMHK
jgi:copper chaperone CopZ